MIPPTIIERTARVSHSPFASERERLHALRDAPMPALSTPARISRAAVPESRHVRFNATFSGDRAPDSPARRASRKRKPVGRPIPRAAEWSGRTNYSLVNPV